MGEPRYKSVGESTASPTSMTRRKEILVPKVLTDYTLEYHYGDLDRTPVRNATFLATLSDGEVRKGTLDDKGQAQLCGVAKGPVSVQYQYDAPETDDAAIVTARDKIRQALDAIVAQTKLDLAEEWKEWNEAGWLKREYLKTINTAQGGAVGAWHWLSGTVETVWQLGVLLHKFDKEKREINWLFFTGQWVELDKKLASYRSKGAEVLAEAGEVKELLNLIFHDQKTRDLITAFASQWWAAIPPDEQFELAASGGMQIIIDVVIGVLLAAFTAGAGGAAYGSAKWAAAGGRLGARLKKLLDTLKEAFEELAKALRVRKRKTSDELRRADSKKVVATQWATQARRKLAEDFYRKQGFADHRIAGHLQGIDFDKPVEVVTLKKGTVLSQYQAPGGAQGTYYAHKGATPSSLGIAPEGLDPVTKVPVPKKAVTYIVTKDVEALQSTAAAIKDTWSIPGKTIPTDGGATQYMTSAKEFFKAIGESGK